jgi:hypothetical protein
MKTILLEDMKTQPCETIVINQHFPYFCKNYMYCFYPFNSAVATNV